MKSAFFILILLLPFSLLAETITVANQSGRLKSVNVIHNLGYKYSDFEYTSSCIIDDYKYDANALSFDGKVLEAIPGQNSLLYKVANQNVPITMGMPILLISNRVCVPINDYFSALDSLGICKVVSRSNNVFRISDYSILRLVPKINQFSNKYNLAYFEQVYKEVNNKNTTVPTLKKRITSSNTTKNTTKKAEDKTLDLIKDALKDEKSETPKSANKKDDYYDIPRGLNRDDALKKKN